MLLSCPAAQIVTDTKLLSAELAAYFVIIDCLEIAWKCLVIKLHRRVLWLAINARILTQDLVWLAEFFILFALLMFDMQFDILLYHTFVYEAADDAKMKVKHADNSDE